MRAMKWGASRTLGPTVELAILWAVVSLVVASGLSIIGGEAGGFSRGAADHPSPDLPASTGSLALEAAESSLAAGSGPAEGRPFQCVSVASGSDDCAPRTADPSAAPADPYDGWGNMTPYLAQSPPPRYGSSIVYDANATDGYVVLFGGEGADGPLGDTWEYQGGTWTNVTPAIPSSTNTPSPRFGAAMAYDSKAGFVVLFGGAYAAYTGSNSPFLGDTWSFVHGTWSPLCTACTAGLDEPAPRMGSMASDDPSDGGVLLFGGLTATSGVYTPLNDTWLFTGSVWSELSPALSPPARYGGGLAANETSGQLVLFGGCSSSYSTGGPTCTAAFSDTWTFASGVWTEVETGSSGPSARTAFGFAASSISGETIAFGGLSGKGLLNQTWEFGSGTWSGLTNGLLSSPSPRDGVAEAFDAGSATDYFLVFGGWNGTYLNQTWVYPSPFSPLRISAPTASPDIVDADHWVHFNVSVAGGTGPYNISWFGLPEGCPSANATSIKCHFGTPFTGPEFYSISARVRDSAGSIVWSASTSVQVNSLPLVSIPNTSNVGIPPWNVTLEATVVGGTAPYVCTWDFGDGSANVTGNPVSHEYTAVGNFSVTVLLNDSFGETSLAHSELHLVPALTVAIAANPGYVIAGSWVTLAATAAGGIPPYSYEWSGLPPPCAAASNATVSCAPTRPGSYVLSVGVLDSVGDNVTNSWTLIVQPQNATATWFGLSPVEIVALGALATAVVVAAAVLAVRRSRRGSPPRAPVPPQSPPTPPSG